MTRMKLWMLSAVCLPVATAVAQTNDMGDKPLFRANEASLDLFGTLSIDQDTIDHISGQRIEDNGTWGAGIGFNYFPLRFLGFGADAYSQNTTGIFVDNASANLILRFPLDSIHLAPYIYGGGGYQFDPGEVWFGQVGAGLEFRVTRHFGLFADARYVIPHEEETYGMARAGLRFAF